MDCDVPPSSPTGAGAHSGPLALNPALSAVKFDPQTAAAQSADDPTLAICKRELEAVLASLDS